MVLHFNFQQCHYTVTDCYLFPNPVSFRSEVRHSQFNEASAQALGNLGSVFVSQLALAHT